MRAGVASTGVGTTKLRQLFAEALKKFQQLAADVGADFLPAGRVLGFAAEKKNGVALQLGHFQGRFNLMDDGFHQLDNQRLAVRERLGVGGHVARVAADVRDN